jgi:hypothetical protein
MRPAQPTRWEGGNSEMGSAHHSCPRVTTREAAIRCRYSPQEAGLSIGTLRAPLENDPIPPRNAPRYFWPALGAAETKRLVAFASRTRLAGTAKWLRTRNAPISQSELPFARSAPTSPFRVRNTSDWTIATDIRSAAFSGRLFVDARDNAGAPETMDCTHTRRSHLVGASQPEPGKACHRAPRPRKTCVLTLAWENGRCS